MTLSSPSVTLVTCARWPEISNSDRLYAAALQESGARVSAAPWNGPLQPFLESDAAVLRSNWDYHYDLPSFRAWLDTLTAAGVRIFNPPDLVRWNLHKRYLLDRGAPVPATRVVPFDPAAVAAACRALGGDALVLKPAAGASGHNVRLIDPHDPDPLAALDATGYRDDLLVQELIPEVAAQGELAYVFFDGDFAHVLRRLPAPGEFRVNGQYGGHIEPAVPQPATIAQARAILDLLPELPLYARVDGVLRDGRLILMELELNEPGLALDLAPAAATRFAAATLARMR